MSKEQEEEEWTTVRTVFGKLIGIDKGKTQITLEYKDSSTEEWVTEVFSTSNFKKEDYEELRRHIGSDIEVNLTDNEVDKWRRA